MSELSPINSTNIGIIAHNSIQNLTQESLTSAIVTSLIVLFLA